VIDEDLLLNAVPSTAAGELERADTVIIELGARHRPAA